MSRDLRTLGDYVALLGRLELEQARAAYFEGGPARVQGLADLAWDRASLELEIHGERRFACSVRRVDALGATVAERRAS